MESFVLCPRNYTEFQATTLEEVIEFFLNVERQALPLIFQ